MARLSAAINRLANHQQHDLALGHIQPLDVDNVVQFLNRQYWGFNVCGTRRLNKGKSKI